MIPHASRPKNQNVKQKQYCNKFNEDFKNGPHQKSLKKEKFKLPQVANGNFVRWHGSRRINLKLFKGYFKRSYDRREEDKVLLKLYTPL